MKGSVQLAMMSLGLDGTPFSSVSPGAGGRARPFFPDPSFPIAWEYPEIAKEAGGIPGS